MSYLVGLWLALSSQDTCERIAPLDISNMQVSTAAVLRRMIQLANDCGRIARACRRDDELFDGFLERKPNLTTSSPSTPKLDYKTVADVLIQSFLTFRIGQSVR